jgi:hypothetical protein
VRTRARVTWAGHVGVSRGRVTWAGPSRPARRASRPRRVLERAPYQRFLYRRVPLPTRGRQHVAGDTWAGSCGQADGGPVGRTDRRGQRRLQRSSKTRRT